MTLSQNLSNNLKLMRSIRQRSLTDFAMESGVGRSTLYSLENGNHNPTLDTVDMIAARLRVPALQLLSDQPLPTNDVGIIWISLHDLNTLPSDRRRLITMQLQSLVSELTQTP